MITVFSEPNEKFVLSLTPCLQASFQFADIDGHEDEHLQLKQESHSVIPPKAEPGSEGSCDWLKCHPIKEEKEFGIPFIPLFMFKCILSHSSASLQP